MLDIHNDFARFMERICPMPRKKRHPEILKEIASHGGLERIGGDVVIRLHGLIGRGRDEKTAVGEWLREAKDARERQADGRAA